MKLVKITIIAILISALTAQTGTGTGADGPLNIPVGETVTLGAISTVATGINPIGNYSINIASTAGFNSGDEILIITMQDPARDFSQNQTGRYELNSIQSVGAGILQLMYPLAHDFSSGEGIVHQVVRVPNYTSVTVDGTLTCASWDGVTGGILAFKATSTVAVSETGIIDASGKGYRGGTQYGSSHGGGQGGESYIGIGGNGGNYNYNDAQEGAGGGGASYAYNQGARGWAGGGGGGTSGSAGIGSPTRGGAGGGGGGHAGSGGGAGYGSFGFGGWGYANQCIAADGGDNTSGDGCVNYTGGGGGGGGSYGIPDLSKIYLGSGGGCSGRHDGHQPGFGGNGGGVLFAAAADFVNNGIIRSDGADGGNGSTYSGGGGAGAGGSLFLIGQSLTNTGEISTAGGTGGNGYYGNPGGNGGVGITRLDFLSTVNPGTVNPDPFNGNLAFGIYHDGISDTNDDTGPYVVEASIYDQQGDTITSASLFYRVNGGAYSELAMSAVNDTVFTAQIPGQAINSVIEYYLYATDGTDEYYAPELAPAFGYVFTITGFPPENLILTDNHDLTVGLNWDPPVDLQNFTGYVIHRSEVSGFSPDGSNLVVTGLTDTSFTDTGLSDFHRYYYLVGAVFDYNGTTNINYTGGDILVDDPDITTLYGYVFLEGQTNHANIKVKFIPVSPSAQPDSVYTNALGYFETNIYPGVYDITYSKTGYSTYQIVTNQSVIVDLDLGESTIYAQGQNNISGDISGVWDGIYTVTGDVTVAGGDSLIILPGSQIRIAGNYNFSVNGYLSAVGTENDSIVFTPVNSLQSYTNGDWQGIDFNDSSDDNSIIKYAIIEYAVDGVYWGDAGATLEDALIHHCSDNGLETNGDNADPNVSRVVTRHNSNHGLYSYNGDGVFDQIYSHHNAGYGAYFNHYAYVTVTNSQFNQNASHGIRFFEYSWSSFDNCEIRDNGSWGVRIDYSSPLFTNTTISGNSGHGVRYNNDNDTWSTPRFDNCTIANNSGTGISLRYRTTADSYISDCIIRNNSGQGIYMEYYNDLTIANNSMINNGSHGIYINNNNYNDPDIHHNVIAYNHGDGIYKNYEGSPKIWNNTIYGNWGDGIDINSTGAEIISHNIIVNNGSYGISANAAIETFEYNLITENLTAPVSNIGNLPVDSWDFISFNAQGDTADIYLNIVEPAQFIFSDSTDFRLQSVSPAINTGNPTRLDPDGTPADLGALYFDFGNPRGLQVTGYGEQFVTLEWAPVDRDSLVSYNIYFRTADSLDFSFWGSVPDTAATVDGLENNLLYQFTVTSQYPNSESVFSPVETEKPGFPQLSVDPDALNFDFVPDTTVQTVTLTNTGTRDLNVDFPLGMDEGSARFDGSWDHIQVGDYPNLDGMDALTLECWIKRYNSGHSAFISKHYLRYSLYIDSSNHLGMYKGYDAGNQLYQGWSTGWVLPENEWHHVAVTWTGNTIKFYVDAELVYEANNAVADPIPAGGYNFQLGKRADYNGLWLDGNLAEVRVWDVVRSQDEILRYKDRPLNGDEPGLAGYWPLHHDYLDYSVWGRNGSVNGNVYISSDTPPALPKLPFTLETSQFLLAPGENTGVNLQFYDAGLTGTSIFTTPILTNTPGEPPLDYEISVTYTAQIPSTPVHFTPVSPTGLPYTVVITDAAIDDSELGVGDEVALFDGALCVGAGVFDGSFNFVLTAWQGDEGQNLAGFVPGNPITFAIYDNSADLEATVTPAYSIGNGTFGYGQFTAVSLTSTVYQIQQVPVQGGLFNLISFNLLPRYSPASVVFGDMNDLRIVYNDTGAALIPEYGINSIGDIDFRDGFHLYTTVSDTINFEGIAITPSEWFINVSANRWNSIAFLGNVPLDVTAAFPDTLIDSISIVQTFDGSVWIPALGVNTMINMIPGYGYQIALSGDTDISFSYQTGGGMARPLAKATSEPEHFQIMETGLPYAIVVDIPDAELSNWQTGDELAVYDNDLCVGAAVFGESSRLTVTAWGSDPDFDIAGFTTGADIQFQAYHNLTDGERPLTFRSLNGNTRFGQGDFAWGEVSGSALIPTEFALKQNYPNPFNPVTNIEYTLPKNSHVTLTVYTLTGQQVAALVNENKTAGYYQIQWNGMDNSGIPVASGLYFYYLKADGFEQTHKMLLLK